MGKTYRGNRNKYRRWGYGVFDNKESYIKDQINREYLRNVRYGEWIDRSEEEIAFDYAEKLPQYEKEMRYYKQRLHEFNKTLLCYEERCRTDEEFRKSPTRYKPRMWLSEPRLYVERKKRVPFQMDYDTFYKENYKRHSDYYDSFYSRGYVRDGIYNETGRNSGFKHAVEKDRRTSDRRNIHKLMVDIDAADDIVWYDRKDGKNRIWDFW